jgi:hypothetical protein
VRINVRGGTVDHGRRSLCESCRWSTVIRGPKLGDEIVECYQLSYINRRVPFPVTSCSDYLGRNQTTIKDMEAIAWVLRSDPRRNQVGFVHSTKLTDDERYVLPDE